MAGVLLEVSFGGAVLDSNPIGNGTVLGLLSIVAVALPPVRELLIQLTASPAFLLDIAIESIFADRDTKLQTQSLTDDLW